RVAEFAEEARHRMQVVHRDVVADVDRVGAQQIAQYRDLYRLRLDVVEDGLVQVARADAVIGRIVKPVVPAQHVRQPRLADARHPEQRDAFLVPRLELAYVQSHRAALVAFIPLLYSRALAICVPHRDLVFARARPYNDALFASTPDS